MDEPTPQPLQYRGKVDEARGMATIRDKKMEIKSPSIHSRLLLSVPITAQICAKSLSGIA
jgi:hypothetical protein